MQSKGVKNGIDSKFYTMGFKNPLSVSDNIKLDFTGDMSKFS